MLSKRIIPCLDVFMGKVVKGINFINIKEVGDPVASAKFYNDEGADEIVFLDITASYEGRKTMLDIVEKAAENIFIPLTVGGGIRDIEDIRNTLKAGADKVSLNSSAVKNPDIIDKASSKFGNQCITIALDAKRRKDNTGFNVYINGGRTDTGLDAVKWAKEAQKRGAGEILLTSMDYDGTKAGYDIPLTKAICSEVSIPVIASGGCGRIEHFYDALKDGMADAALAASLFHYRELSIRQVKEYLKDRNIEVRL